MNEVYLIKYLGYERVATIFEDFYKNTVINLEFLPQTIASRFAIYENNLKKIDADFVLTNKAKNRFTKAKNFDILHELGKDYFNKGWLFHSDKTFRDVLRGNPSYGNAKTNLEKLGKHIEDLRSYGGIQYKSEYFEDRSSAFDTMSREEIKRMKREREVKAKSLQVELTQDLNRFYVLSQSNKEKKYSVLFHPKIECDCRDFQFRKTAVKECKHIKAAKPMWNNTQLV